MCGDRAARGQPEIWVICTNTRDFLDRPRSGGPAIAMAVRENV